VVSPLASVEVRSGVTTKGVGLIVIVVADGGGFGDVVWVRVLVGVDELIQLA